MSKLSNHTETDCTFTHEGRTFEIEGSWFQEREPGRFIGIVYAYERDGKVGTWHGDIKVPARFGRTWRSAFGDTRQSVYFTWDSINFYGVYYKSGSDIVRCRSVKAQA